MAKQCSTIHSCGLFGLDGIFVTIEVSILPGLPAFDIVGLGDSAVRESRDRVRAAICNSGFAFPNGHLIACYAPAWLRKEGSGFDLPLALAILAASGQIKLPENKLVVIGELGLNGAVRHVPGVFCRALACREQEQTLMVVPRDDKTEAAAVLCGRSASVAHLQEVVQLLDTMRHSKRPGFAGQIPEAAKKERSAHGQPADKHLENINDKLFLAGQQKAVRALTLSAAGHHNLLMLGSPGCGKTTLASALPYLMPPLPVEESIEVTRIYSAAGLLAEGSGLVYRRPFRAPHHATTRAAMIGGGIVPMPGEVSLAHRGVLFLDELTEFKPDILDLLRQPMEQHCVHLTRLRYRLTYPSDFLLVGAANPCQCGDYYEPAGTCRCTVEKVREHLNRISGPIIDRMHITVEMTRLSAEDLAQSVSFQKGSRALIDLKAVRSSIDQCRKIQTERCQAQNRPVCRNGLTPASEINSLFAIDESLVHYAGRAAQRLQMSARGYHNMLRVARTIADLEQRTRVQQSDIDEAFQYRMRWPQDR